MPALVREPTITKQGVEFEEYRVLRRTERDEVGRETVSTVILVGYRVPTDDGDVFRRKAEMPLTGTDLTRANNMFTSVETFLKSEEGIP